jgi:polygalacturonase
MYIVQAVLLACIVVLASQADGAEGRVFDIREYGAVADGVTVNTEAIQKAIDACVAAGGGTVVIPSGRFVSGTIFMKSGVELYLQMSAELLGSTNLADYPLTLCDYPSRSDAYTARALIWGEGLSRIAITGHGTIDGQGAAFHGKIAEAEDIAEITRLMEEQGRHKPIPAYYARPYLIRLISCERVRVEDLTPRDSAMWMQQYLNCAYLTVRGLHVVNHVAKNNDMIDIDGCRYVTISDCFGDTSDDALTLKSTGAAATEFVTITNCILSSHCNALKMGTESAGGFRDIAITNCVIKRSSVDEVIAGRREGLAGVALEIVDGGAMDRIAISNLSIEGYTAPIFLRLGNRARPPKASDPAPPVGTMRNISINNIVATGASATGCAIAGLPGHPIEHVSISGVRLNFAGGGTLADFERAIPEEETKYPESTMFGTLPAYGFYIRHGHDIAVDNVVLQHDLGDARPGILCDDVTRVRLHNVYVEKGEHAPARVVLKDTRDSDILHCNGSERGGFLLLQGDSADVRVYPEAP